MSEQLLEQIPEFKAKENRADQDGIANWSALTDVPTARNAGEAAVIVAVAAVVIGGTELLLRFFQVPSYIFPTPSAIFVTLINLLGSWDLMGMHIWVTIQELVSGYVIGAIIGMVLAGIVTQMPFVEKVVTPYIILLVTTPMLALVPLLILKLGFGMSPRIVAVALAVGPMVMINSATGFRRTDLAKIALARSYGANTLQIFTKIRFPLALPMIIVGLMVGGIFGLLTAIGAEMAGGNGTGLGSRLNYYSQLARMEPFFATVIIIAAIGIGMYVLFYFIGKKWASWEA